MFSIFRPPKWTKLVSHGTAKTKKFFVSLQILLLNMLRKKNLFRFWKKNFPLISGLQGNFSDAPKVGNFSRGYFGNGVLCTTIRHILASAKFFLSKNHSTLLHSIVPYLLCFSEMILSLYLRVIFYSGLAGGNISQRTGQT